MRNPEGNVWFYRNQWLGPIRTNDEYVLPQNWIRTSRRSRVNLWIPQRGAGYKQGPNTSSQFAQDGGNCKFRLAIGGVIYYHGSSKYPCVTLTPNARIRAPGTAYFVTHNSGKTVVGALTDSSEGAVTVFNARGDRSVELTSGQFAAVATDGAINLLGEFSLREFYQNNSLALGLGPGLEHKQYIEQQPPKLRAVLSEVRNKAIDAVIKQESSDVTYPKSPIDIERLPDP